jgi:predicted nucleic acid-binding protein
VREIVLDASVVIKVVVPEDMSDKADGLISDSKARGVCMIVPHLYEPESLSVLSRKVWAGDLTKAQADTALKALKNIPVNPLSFAGKVDRAWAIVGQFNMRYAYDAFYVALAEHRGCKLWTADKKLYNTVHNTFPFVDWLGNYRNPE